MLSEKIHNIKDGDKGKAQFIRFIMNGCLAAAIHYTIYYILQKYIEVNVAYSIGYAISFLVNYYTTCRFTFRQSPTCKHFAGFAGSHTVNYLLQAALFWICMQIGVHRLVAPVIVMTTAMLVQFTILRLVFKKS